MEHLQIAYDLFVIMIGLAALSIVVFWAARTGESDLRNFSILYTCFTLVLIVELLEKYLFLNVEDYSARLWYALSGIGQGLNIAVIVAAIHFFAGVYQVRYQRAITIFFLVVMLVSLVLILSPIGAVLNAEARSISFRIGFKIASVFYFVAFTFMMALGYGLLRRAWQTERRNFLIGLLLFATVGFIETTLSLPVALRRESVTISTGSNFLYSSIPYALYGIFLIFYFLRYPALAPLEMDDLSATFLSKYGITDREREIILKVVQGKSNADIASELFISLATVKTHLHNIYRKIEVDSRYDLLARVRSGQ
ncbi:MAG TPA: helix-turn-helix transcriptional regulator [Anaerolineales bacterium]|nr:helix-turn-helix transcriptional regulator [Anaerolineales bacterium]